MSEHQQPARTLCAAFQRTAARCSDRIALRGPTGTPSLTWRDYAARVRAIATGSAACHVRPGDTVALMLTNIPEFHLADTAVLHAGAVPFSIYNTFAPEQISHLFDNAGNRVVITESNFLETIRAADPQGRIELIVCVDGPADGCLTLDELAALPDPDFDFDATWQAVDENALATIVYTSGTTGPPKGVELTHANLLAEFAAVESLLPVGPDDRVVSYLPDAHLANRAFCHYNNIVEGVQITTVADPKQLIEVLPQVRPTLFLAVPAIWYKIKSGIEGVVAQRDPVTRRILEHAIGVGTEVARRRSDRRPIPLPLRVRHEIVQRTVLRALRARMGLDEVRAALSGAAPIAPDAMAFILGLGLTVCEAWGDDRDVGGRHGQSARRHPHRHRRKTAARRRGHRGRRR